MSSYQAPPGVLGVGFPDGTYAVVGGILVLPDGVSLGDVGDGFTPVPQAKGAKPTLVKIDAKSVASAAEETPPEAAPVAPDVPPVPETTTTVVQETPA